MLKSAHTPQQLACFDALYDRYAAAFYGEIKRNLYHPETCNQTLQNGFHQIWEKMADLPEDELPPFCWCYRIVRKEMIKKKIELALKEIFSCQQMTNKVA